MNIAILTNHEFFRFTRRGVGALRSGIVIRPNGARSASPHMMPAHIHRPNKSPLYIAVSTIKPLTIFCLCIFHLFHFSILSEHCIYIIINCKQQNGFTVQNIQMCDSPVSGYFFSHFVSSFKSLWFVLMRLEDGGRGWWWWWW